ncbi:MAG: 60S ribosomal protein L31 [Nanoarchaeota archaeon]|nr:60S ribosomal protein L31 [Nanoarchaeota archaeon]
MAELKREYIIPLRRRFVSAPKWRRSKKAVAVLRDFITKHMKCENVIVCAELNEHIWSRGSKHPPGKVEVIALRFNDGSEEKVLVNLKEFGVDSQRALYNASVAAPAISDKEVVDAQVEEKESKQDEEKTTEKKSDKVEKEDKKNG